MKTKEITTITADSQHQNESYRLLVMIHSMAGRCAIAKVDGWVIHSCFTYQNDVMTAWTNGVVIVKARTVDGVHYYSMAGEE